MKPFISMHWFKPRNWSFRTRLTLFAILLVVLAMTSATIITTLTVRAALTEQIGQRFEAEAESLSDLVSAFFLAKASQMQALALTDVVKEAIVERNASYVGSADDILTQIQALDEQWVAAPDNDPLILSIITPERAATNGSAAAFQLQEFLEAFPEHSEIFVTDRYGATIAATGRLSDYEQADEAWWQAAWNDGQGALYISAPEFDESARVTASLLAVPVFNQGELIGVLRSTLTLDDLLRGVIAETTIGESGHAVLFDSEGKVLLDPHDNNERGSADLPADLRQRFREVQEVAKFEVALDEKGQASIFGYSRLHAVAEEIGLGEVAEPLPAQFNQLEQQIVTAVVKLGWTVVVRQKAAEAFAPLEFITQAIQLIGLIIMGLSAILATLFATTITRPLQTLSQAAAQIGAGNLDAPLPAAGGDELGHLTASFGTMTARLRELISELTGRTETLQRYTQQQQVAAEVSEQINAILEPERLLSVTVSLLQERFDLYHVHIYLTDSGQDQLVMAMGSGSVGQKLHERNHKIDFKNEKSIVAQVARSKQAVLVNETRISPIYLPNEFLPDTRSEVAVPLVTGERLLGVLDVQDNQPERFTESDVDLLTVVAGQIATALENARKQTQTEQARSEAERERNLLNSILAALPVGVYVCDRQGGPIRSNQMARILFEHKIAQPPTKEEPIYQVVVADSGLPYPEEQLPLVRTLCDGLPDSCDDMAIIQSNGTKVALLVNSGPLLDQNGQMIGATVAFSDISERRRVELALRESEERFRRTFNDAPIGIALLKPEGQIMQVNKAVCEMLGYSEEELLTQSFEQLTHTNQREMIRRYLHQMLMGKKSIFQIIIRYIHKQGHIVWVQLSVSAVRDQQGQLLYFVSQLQDITERRRAELALQRSEIRQRAILDASPDLMFRFNCDGEFLDLEASSGNWLFVAREEVIGRNVDEVLPLEVSEQMREAISQALHTGQMQSFEYKWPFEEQALTFEARVVVSGADEALAIIRNISERKRAEEVLQQANDELERRVVERTGELEQANQLLQQEIGERKQAEEQLKASLKEKEVLLKEIHHRVKNNLQIISSLLYLQAENIKDSASRKMFKESQNRVKSMALIHEQLYQTDNLARINLADYIERLTNHLSRSYGANHISLQLNIEPLFLSIETAMPCGLIINELVTNAMKYAFPAQQSAAKRSSQIWLEVQPSDNQHLTLSVRDNGVGFPTDINVYRPRSLGLTLVTTLVKQLKGTLELQPKNGTKFKIRFSDSSIKREGQTHESNAHSSG